MALLPVSNPWRYITCALWAALLWAPSVEAASGSSCQGCVTDAALKCLTYQCDNSITPSSVTVTLSNCLNLSFVTISYNGQCYKVASGGTPVKITIPCSGTLSTLPLVFITHDGKYCNPNGGATSTDVRSCYNTAVNKNQLQGVCFRTYTAASNFTPCSTISGLTCPAPDLTETPTAQVQYEAALRDLLGFQNDGVLCNLPPVCPVAYTYMHAARLSCTLLKYMRQCVCTSLNWVRPLHIDVAADGNTHEPADANAHQPADANAYKPADAIAYKPAYTHTHKPANAITHKPTYTHAHCTAYPQPHRAAHSQAHFGGKS
ncbi:hypothetical protein JKP88DRAFT_254948 [Tribonema minus]|uniref:Uncharacterized protein n=1 Tax=Tribonema minus TaxID=303371 RepID=A0A835Z0X3_9STRA|nr:hypothetical protein JKP88DRAFT_254948 [Tribonema minus]